MGVKETGCEVVEWIQLADDRVQCRALLNTVMIIRVPWGGAYLDQHGFVDLSVEFLPVHCNLFHYSNR
jgi:hypothetical protein